MRFEIKNRFTGEVVVSGEAESLIRLVEQHCSNLSWANLSRANLSGADLSRADLSRADLSGANLSRATLSWANLSRADLSGANLSRATLSWANLSWADLSGADLSGADLSRADLSGADLSRADLSWANLSWANLSGANLYGANLSRATLSGATLSRAYLSGADLSGADLSRADLSGARGVNKYKTTTLYMLLDQPGRIRAYKLVRADGRGPYYGGITYEVGNVYDADADTDEEKQCSHGISLASLDWCMGNWQPEYRILIAEFEAADIAAIPVATDGKFRVHRCKIVGEKDLKELGLVEEMAEGGKV